MAVKKVKKQKREKPNKKGGIHQNVKQSVVVNVNSSKGSNRKKKNSGSHTPNQQNSVNTIIPHHPTIVLQDMYPHPQILHPPIPPQQNPVLIERLVERQLTPTRLAEDIVTGERERAKHPSFHTPSRINIAQREDSYSDLPSIPSSIQSSSPPSRYLSTPAVRLVPRRETQREARESNALLSQVESHFASLHPTQKDAGGGGITNSVVNSEFSTASSSEKKRRGRKPGIPNRPKEVILAEKAEKITAEAKRRAELTRFLEQRAAARDAQQPFDKWR